MDRTDIESGADAWATPVEQLCKVWGEKAQGNQLLHAHEAKQWRTYSNRCHLGLIVLTSICSVAGLVNTNSIWMRYAVSGLSAATGALASTIKFYKPDEKAQIHSAVSRRYAALYREVVLDLSVTRNDRKPAELVSSKLRLKMDQLQHEARAVSQRTIDWFVASAKAADVDPCTFPDAIREFVVPIDINNGSLKSMKH
jgi:hypothetical protein